MCCTLTLGGQMGVYWVIEAFCFYVNGLQWLKDRIQDVRFRLRRNPYPGELPTSFAEPAGRNWPSHPETCR